MMIIILYVSYNNIDNIAHCALGGEKEGGGRKRERERERERLG